MKDIGLLILRLGMGALMLPHGIPKLQKLFAGGEIKFADVFGMGSTVSLVLAVLAEFVCAILIILGLKTRWASFPLAITMAIAAFYVLLDDPWRKKELAVLYLVGYVAIIFLGSGKYSIDAMISKKTR